MFGRTWCVHEGWRRPSADTSEYSLQHVNLTIPFEALNSEVAEKREADQCREILARNLV